MNYEVRRNGGPLVGVLASKGAAKRYAARDGDLRATAEQDYRAEIRRALFHLGLAPTPHLASDQDAYGNSR